MCPFHVRDEKKVQFPELYKSRGRVRISGGVGGGGGSYTFPSASAAGLRPVPACAWGEWPLSFFRAGKERAYIEK